MNQSVSQAELRLTVAKLIEVSYRRNEGLTTTLVKEVGKVKLSVDHNGRATLSGTAGVVAFSGDDALKQIGAVIRGVTVVMNVDDQGVIQYQGSVRLGVTSVIVRGSIDVEKLLTACSGILCQATRAMKSRSEHVDRELRRALGN